MTTPDHDLAHQLLTDAGTELDGGDTATAIAKAEEALDLFWEVDEPCHGISESL